MLSERGRKSFADIVTAADGEFLRHRYDDLDLGVITDVLRQKLRALRNAVQNALDPGT